MVCVCFCHMLSIRLPYKACTRKPSALGKAPKNLLANAGDVGSIPGSGRPLEKEKATHPSILAWEILQTEGPGGLQFMGSLKESDMTARLNNNNFYNSCPGSMGCLSHHGPGPSPTCIHSPVSSITQSCPTPCHPKDCSTQASLSISNSRSLLKLMSIESVMPSNHLILCCPLFLLPSIFPSIGVFSNELVLRIR